LLVAVVALSAFGWILNDVRLEIKGLAEKADKQLPQILSQAAHVASQLDQHLPRLLAQSETAANTINAQVPRLLQLSQRAVQLLDRQLPPLLATAGTAVDNLADLTDSFNEYRDLMGVVHRASQNKSLFSYGSSILNFIDGQDATIGTKKPGTDNSLKHAMPARDWAKAARKHTHFLSLVSNSKAEMLHGLAKTRSATPWYVQIGTKAPRALADWLRDVHPESKDVK
jgi:hypothetical protein